MLHGGMTGAAELTDLLTDYYQANNGWGGVEAFLEEQLLGTGMMGSGHGAGGPGGMMGARLLLADAEGTVLFNQGMPAAQSLSSSQQSTALELTVDGDVVGYLSLGGGLGVEEQQVVERLDRAIILAALAGGGAALLLAAVFIAGLLRPVRQLTQAAQKLGAGDLGQRVAIGSHDEIGDLAGAFNEMAGSLEGAEQRRRELTAEIAHELRNPLAVMQARMEGLIDGVYPATEEELKPALEQTRLLNRLVEDLRLLALADEGQLGLDRQSLDVASLVRDIVEAYRPRADQAGVDLHAGQGLGATILLNVDAGRLSQIVGNLLDNAIRHTPPGTTVVVDLEASQNKVRLMVQDQGPGIAPEDLPHIFKRFYRADSARSRQAGGSGLGLAIARKLTEAHGGMISASNLPGGGAKFEVTFSRS
jgi:two-component system OmpR family sensor kinase/two-component system sensor histidine kinase BaeS